VQKTITLGGELLRKSPFLNLMIMGVDHGGNGETSPPEYGVGDANANCPPLLRFCHTSTKKSVLWPSKYAKIRFRQVITMIRTPCNFVTDCSWIVPV